MSDFMDRFHGNKQVGDELEQRIIDRLGSRQDKIDRMMEWEKGKKRNLRAFYVAVSTAASLVLFVVLAKPFLKSDDVAVAPGVETSRMMLYRAAVPELVEIEQLMSAGKYHEALDVARGALEMSDMAVAELEAQAAWGDEEWEYELSSERVMNAELRWMYISLLVHIDCGGDAVMELEKYLKNGDCCPHKDEAESILRALLGQ